METRPFVRRIKDRQRGSVRLRTVCWQVVLRVFDSCNNSRAKAQDCGGCWRRRTRERPLVESDIAERSLRRGICLHALIQLAGSNTRLDRFIASHYVTPSGW
jgi:hypothetical protein